MSDTSLLDLRSVTAGYGGPPAIRDISLRVAPGELVALLGANGAGKSTVLLTIAGELPISSGDISFGSQVLRGPLHRRARSGIGYVPEGRSLFKSMTTQENLRVARVEIDAVLGLFPELESRLSIRGGLLSGGEQQMLALGRALCRNPTMLMADELSLGLAPMVATRLLEAIKSATITRQTGALVVEQQVRKVLRYADRVYVLRRGEVAISLAATEAAAHIDEIEAMYLSSESMEVSG